MTDRLVPVSLGGFLVVVGLSHFLWPRYYETLVPVWLPGRRLLVLLSGVVEMVIGGGLLLERTRHAAAVAAVALMLVYVLTHLDALRRATPEASSWLDRPVPAVARVLVNLAYLAWAMAAVGVRQAE